MFTITVNNYFRCRAKGKSRFVHLKNIDLPFARNEMRNGVKKERKTKNSVNKTIEIIEIIEKKQIEIEEREEKKKMKNW
jgi:hypothetical protein